LVKRLSWEVVAGVLNRVLGLEAKRPGECAPGINAGSSGQGLSCCSGEYSEEIQDISFFFGFSQKTL
jgi:hypothetical protein